MKKLLALILLVSYFAVSSGVVVNFHYCMNRLASTELFVLEGKKCEQCGMDIHKSHGCCHDEVKVVKMDSDQKVTAAVTMELPSQDVLFQLPSDFIAASFYNASLQKHNQDHSPPLLTEQDTYLHNRVFRI